MLYYIYYLYKYYYYFYYMFLFYYSIKTTYSICDNVSYIYNLIPYNVTQKNTTTVEMYEIESNDEWNIIKLI